MYQDKAEREIEAERARLAESCQARVDAKVAEELQRHDVADQAKAEITFVSHHKTGYTQKD